MKTALDCLVEFGLQNPVVGGVLAEGIYLMNTLSHVHLLRRPMYVTLLPQIVESLLQLRTCIQPTLSTISDLVAEGLGTGGITPMKAWK
ncbi:hypothetical protein BCR43DRAFT_514551 [Syncephalastrum racemosum]|uniref:Uncharacterized protein n=1 Tax=Syncephalastrum racemosum TaxID=13706 RepID=A0A1X2GZ00_SYNRA|nr:hypothetical protein BCR43DRAFT_519411 [Syncephalastrum racemosum]ORY89238.1 hypothetical protein BCR43DRAFT_519412 [Syncephalastrum racemosum]ORY98241.1 hypothetical protein BCR43DRAFT_514551 [Syncephalastrum racemosum]